MSYHQKKSYRKARFCGECGWSLKEGLGIEWRPLFGAYICDDCDLEIQTANIRRAILGRNYARSEAAAEDYCNEIVSGSGTPQLFLTFDDLYERQERRRALQARVEAYD